MRYFVFLVCLLFSSACLSAELNYDDAIELSNKTERQIFLYLGTDWCGYCNKMKEVFGDKEVSEKLDKYIVLMLDADKEINIKRKFSVRGIPDYMIINGNEKVIKRNKGYMNKDSFIKWLD